MTLTIAYLLTLLCLLVLLGGLVALLRPPRHHHPPSEETPQVPDDLVIINLAEASERAALGVPVHGAPATGIPLHSNGHLGADMLHVPAGGQFPVHTHPGDHLLLCVYGEGTISVGERTYRVHPGDLYMVEGLVPHAVGAAPDSEHILVAIGAPHKKVDAPDRMTPVDWHGRQVTQPITSVPAPEPEPEGVW